MPTRRSRLSGSPRTGCATAAATSTTTTDPSATAAPARGPRQTSGRPRPPPPPPRAPARLVTGLGLVVAAGSGRDWMTQELREGWGGGGSYNSSHSPAGPKQRKGGHSTVTCVGQVGGGAAHSEGGWRWARCVPCVGTSVSALPAALCSSFFFFLGGPTVKLCASVRTGCRLWLVPFCKLVACRLPIAACGA